MVKLLLLSLISFNTFATEAWERDVLKLLPAPLSSFMERKPTLQEIEKKFGKADLTEENKYYWIRDGLKYALQLTFNKNKLVSEINYTFTGKLPPLARVGNIKTSNLKPFINKGKASDRYFVLESKETQLVIDPVSKTLYSVRVR